MRISDWSSDVCSSDLSCMCAKVSTSAWQGTTPCTTTSWSTVKCNSREVSFDDIPINVPVADLNINDLLKIPRLHIEEHAISHHDSHIDHGHDRSEERSVGKEVVSQGQDRWAPR